MHTPANVLKARRPGGGRKGEGVGRTHEVQFRWPSGAVAGVAKRRTEACYNRGSTL